MTQLEALSARIELVYDAGNAIRKASINDQVISGNKHIALQYSLAINELSGLCDSLVLLKIRIETIGR